MEILWKPELVDDDTGAGWCLKRKKYTADRHYWCQPFSDSSASRWKAENTKSFSIFKQEAILRFHFSYFPESAVVLTSSDTQLWGRKFPQLPMWKKQTHTSWMKLHLKAASDTEEQRREKGNEASDVTWNLVCQWSRMAEITWLNWARTWKQFCITQALCCERVKQSHKVGI